MGITIGCCTKREDDEVDVAAAPVDLEASHRGALGQPLWDSNEDVSPSISAMTSLASCRTMSMTAFRATLAKSIPSFRAMVRNQSQGRTSEFSGLTPKAALGGFGMHLTPSSYRTSHCGGVENALDAEQLADHQDFIANLRSRPPLKEQELWTVDEFDNEAYQAVRFTAIKRAVLDLRRYSEDLQKHSYDADWQSGKGSVLIAVAVFSNAEGALRSYRGMSSEGPLPSKSLCAERAALGRAISDLRGVAELEAVALLDPQDNSNPVAPCEVCHSWIAGLRSQPCSVSIISVMDSSCAQFSVSVRGRPLAKPRQLPPPPRLPNPASRAELESQLLLAPETLGWPWEAAETVYIDGAWGDHLSDRKSLKTAYGDQRRGVFLVAGIYSDETILQNGGVLPEVEYRQRLEALLEDPNVAAVLPEAPRTVGAEMLSALGVTSVVVDTRTREGRDRLEKGCYEVAREQNLLRILPDTCEEDNEEEEDIEAHRLQSPVASPFHLE